MWRYKFSTETLKSGCKVLVKEHIPNYPKYTMSVEVASYLHSTGRISDEDYKKFILTDNPNYTPKIITNKK